MFDRRIVQKAIVATAVMFCFSAVMLVLPATDAAAAMDEMLSELLTGDPNLTFLFVIAIIAAVFAVVLVLLFRKGKRQKRAPRHIRDDEMLQMPPMSITTIGEYCLMDDCIRLSSGKEIPYEQIDDVKLSRDYEPMVLLTFGNAWQLTLRAGARTEDLYREIVLRVHQDEIVSRMNKRRQKMIRS